MKVICIIPARIGSLRVKKKNIIDFKGKPLIYWSLTQSKRIKIFNSTIVSSDSNSLLIYAKKKFKKFITDFRPKKLSTHKSKTESLIGYLIKKYKLSSKDAIMILQPTSPLRADKDIRNTIKIFRRNKLKTLHSASIYDKKKIIKKHSYIYDNKNKKADRSCKYSYNGAIYLFRVNYFNKTKKIYEKVPKIYLMDKKHSIDIDNYSDLKGYSNLKVNISD